MPILTELKKAKVPIKIWSPLESIESGALDQLTNTANLPGIFRHLSAMPDLHLGSGCCIGSVLATDGIVIPAGVGVDIGCGVAAVKTPLDADEVRAKLPLIYENIQRVIPVGFNQHKVMTATAENWKGWRNWKELTCFDSKNERDWDLLGKARRQLGTLGGGNHFIEICLDTDNAVWIMLHSGSRHIGLQIAKRHINRAKEVCAEKHIPLVDKNLAFFEASDPEFNHYLNDVRWAQKYAMMNRQEMLSSIMEVLSRNLNRKKEVERLMEVNCHHNFVDWEEHFGKTILITRKGAVSAQEGQMGIIPGSMGTKSYITKGKGNEESFCSSSHGAGRVMSRSKAKKTFNIEDVKKQTEGVLCKKDSTIIDELPGSYKDIDQVMENQKDLVEIVATLKQILCVKG